MLRRHTPVGAAEELPEASVAEDAAAEAESDAVEVAAALPLAAEAASVDAADAAGVEADAALAESVLAAEVEADGAAESVLAGAAVADADAGFAVPLAEPPPEETDVRLHAFSSLTSGLPFASVIGVIVMVHVSCMGPEDLESE